MNITIDSAALRLVCVNAAKNLAGRNGLPIMHCFLFETTDELLVVKTSDGENWSNYCVPANITVMDGERQKFCIEATTFLNMLDELPSQPIGIDVKGNTGTIRYQNGVANLPVLDTKDFPRPLESAKKEVRLSVPLLRDIINRNLFAVADDELRPVMNGICFDFRGKELVTASADQSRLCRYTHPDVEWESDAYIVTKRCAQLMLVLIEHHAKRLGKGEVGEVTLAFSEKNVTIYAGKDSLHCRLISGSYPNYNAVIPQKSPYQLEVNRLEMISAIRRVMVMSSEDSPTIELSAYYGRLVLRANNVDFSSSSEEKLSCRWNGGEGFRIGLSGIFLKEILSYLATEEVSVELTNEKTAAVFRGVGDEEDVLMLLMPRLISS